MPDGQTQRETEKRRYRDDASQEQDGRDNRGDGPSSKDKPQPTGLRLIEKPLALPAAPVESIGRHAAEISADVIAFVMQAVAGQAILLKIRVTFPGIAFQIIYHLVFLNDSRPVGIGRGESAIDRNMGHEWFTPGLSRCSRNHSVAAAAASGNWSR